MAKDAESAASLRRASNEATEAMVRQNKERTRKARTPLAGTVNDLGALVEIIGPITAAKAKLNDAYGAAREYDLSDDHVEAVLEELGEIEQIIDWFRSYLDSGDQSFEDELQKLLADS
jgi:hypothetical protein